MIDFPNNPNVGDSFTSGATIFRCIQNVPAAVWVGSPVDAGIPDAPVDGLTYGRREAAWSALTKVSVGLPNVDNTSDLAKPISTATQTALNAKEPTIAAGGAGQWWRYDKTWQPITIADVQQLQTTLNGKANTSSLNPAGVGLSAVENFRQVRSFQNGTLYLGWESNTLNLQVDNTYFGSTWPINITGNANGTAAAANRTNQSDNCENWGYASGNFNLPYMRYQNSPSIRYLIWQTSNDNTVQCLRQVGNPGYMEVSGSNGAFSTPLASSDMRLKGNVSPSTVDASAVVRGMKLIEFDWVRNGSGHVELGFNAQNLQSMQPRLVTAVEQAPGSPMEDLGAVLNLDTAVIVAYLAKALQEALARIDALEAK